MQPKDPNVSQLLESPHSALSPYAGLASRTVAIIIDLLIIAALLAVVRYIGNLIINAFTFNYRTDELMRIVLGLVLAALPAAYHILFWTLAGQTPGKAIMGIRVVTLDGSPLTLSRSGLRLLGYVPSSFLLIGFLMVLVHPRRQAFHDKLARTVVVYARRNEPSDDISDYISDYLSDEASGEVSDEAAETLS